MAWVGKLKGHSPASVQPAPEWGRLAASLGAPVARPREEAKVPRAFLCLPPGAAALAGRGDVLRLAGALDSTAASPTSQASSARGASRLCAGLLRHLLTPMTLTK